MLDYWFLIVDNDRSRFTLIRTVDNNEPWQIWWFLMLHDRGSKLSLGWAQVGVASQKPLSSYLRALWTMIVVNPTLHHHSLTLVAMNHGHLRWSWTVWALTWVMKYGHELVMNYGGSLLLLVRNSIYDYDLWFSTINHRLPFMNYHLWI